MSRRRLLLFGSMGGPTKAVTLALINQEYPGDHSIFVDQLEILDVAGNVMPGILANSGFEYPVQGQGGMALADPATSNWTPTGVGNAIIHDQFGPFGTYPIPQPNQCLVLQLAGAGVSQTILLSSGTYYRIRFWIRQRYGGAGLQIAFFIDGVEVHRESGPNAWTQYTSLPFLIS
ncbi:hypothetical protein [Hymenobacter rubidus]|uniref:hypothetical protein n=1 Tax=Hymenobacter rubidus TaxID=1441626 RepID=UPI00191D7996|nr:hypothetical protein [Hymenobacter rubidus]